MTKQSKAYIKEKLPYYGKIGPSKGRYKGIKDKAWTILSDYVRMRDWLCYGACVSSGKPIAHWRDGDAGHYYSMGGHGAYIGFDEMNVHMQSPNENRQGSAHSGAYYKEELLRRYDQNMLDRLERLKHETVKADDWFFISRIEDLYEKFKLLKLQFPDGDYPKYI